MSAEAPLLTRAWHVGARTVTFTVPRPQPGHAVHCCCEWSPDEPTRLPPDEWRQYAAGRHAALAEMAAELGITVAVIDL